MLPGIALFVCALGWSVNFIAVKEVIRHIPPESLGLVRWLLMVPLLFWMARLVGEPRRYPTGKLRVLALGSGLLSSGLYMVAFLIGMKYTSPPVAAILLSTAPLFTLLLSVGLSQDRWTARLAAGTFIAFLGVVVVVSGEPGASFGEWRGAGLLLLSSFIWSVSVVMMRPVVQEYPPVRSFALALPAAGLALIPFGWSSAWSLDWTSVPLVTWGWFAWTVLVAGVLGFAGFYIGVQRVGPARASLVGYVVPPMTGFFGWLLLGDAMTPIQWGGLAIVLAGLYWASRKQAMGLAEPTV